MDYGKNPNESYIERIEREFLAIAKQVQSAVLDAVVSGLIGFALNEAGKVVFSVENVGQKTSTLRLTGTILQRGRATLLQRAVAAFLALFDRNTGYFRDMGLTITQEDEARRRLLLLYGYNETTGEVLQGSYLEALLATASMQSAIGQAISSAIQAGDTLVQFRARIRLAINGGQGRPGLVERHIKRLAGDTLAAYDQTVKDDYAERLGLNYAVYAGTAENDTRPFCLARLNLVYTREEILSWNGRNWKGKNTTLPVQLARGGYNCRHAYNWVTDAIAQRIIKQRGGVNTYTAPDRGEIGPA